MARLSIGVERLGAEGFRLELDGVDGAKNIIALAPGGGIRGRYEQDDAIIGLRTIRADTLALSEFAWSSSRARIELAAPSRLTEVEIDATIARGKAKTKFVGSIRAKSIEATVNVVMGATTLHGTTVTIGGFELLAAEDGRVTVRLGTISAGSVRLTGGRVDLTAKGVTTTSPVTIDASGITTDRLDIAELDVRVADLGRSDANADPTPASPAGAPTIPELPFLDHLHGHLHVDVMPDITLPIIGSRKAKHAFRIPIEGGVISIDQLERGLSTLESMVIDFEVEDGKLVLEKDLPLVPFDNKPLVEWPLDAAAQTLADKKHVALRTLLRPTIPQSARKEADKDRAKKGKAIDLRRLDIANIDVDLRCGGPSELPVLGGHVRFGAGDQPALGKLTIKGGIGYAPNDPVAGEVRVGAQHVNVELQDLRLGSRTLRSGVSLQTLDAITVTFAGLSPTALSAKARGLSLRTVTLASDT